MNNAWMIRCWAEMDLGIWPDTLLLMGMWETRFFMFDFERCEFPEMYLPAETENKKDQE